MMIAFTDDGTRGPLLRSALPRPDAVFLNLNEFFDSQNYEQLHLPKDFHWSALGHERVAKAIVRSLVHFGMVPQDICMPLSSESHINEFPLADRVAPDFQKRSHAK